MGDIEATAIAYLTRALGVPAYAEVPRNRPDRFVTVERTGGGTERGIDWPTLAVQSWAPSRHEASALARCVDEAMLAMPDEVPSVPSCESQSIYNFPDPDSGGSRYQGVYNLTSY